jgi:hypothetical protein
MVDNAAFYYNAAFINAIQIRQFMFWKDPMQASVSSCQLNWVLLAVVYAFAGNRKSLINDFEPAFSLPTFAPFLFS